MIILKTTFLNKIQYQCKGKKKNKKPLPQLLPVQSRPNKDFVGRDEGMSNEE